MGGEPGARAGLSATREFVRPDDLVGARQILVTAAAILGVVVGMSQLGASWAWTLAPLLGLLLVRQFVLQHDCGHHSLFRRARHNDLVGTLSSIVLGVPYEAWRTEHDWHHKHQGQLSCRGIDRVNSPMTAQEAREDPDAARKRSRFINVLTVFVFGAHSLTIKRKRPRGFFPFRPGFRWSIRGRERIPRTVYLTGLAHAAVHAGFALTLGPITWLTAILPAYFIGAGVGALLFWVQHNFEHTMHAEDETWRFEDAALRGSSYLALPWPLSWFTGQIGLHHVHHLNPRIPNYVLERARTAIPELAAVRPLGFEGFSRCFSHVFWDVEKDRMVDLEALGIAARPSAPERAPESPPSHPAARG